MPALELRQHYRVVLYFLLGLVVLDLLIICHEATWRTYDPDDYRERLEACRSAGRDILVVGGSSVTEGIDPQLLTGLQWRGERLHSAFNLGLPGGTTSEVWHAVKHGVRQPPKLMIYGVTASDLNDNRNEPHGPYSLMNATDLASWVWHRPNSAEWVTRHFLQARLASAWQFYRYRHGVRLWTADHADRLWPGLCPDAAAEAHANLEHSRDLHGGDGFAPRQSLRQRRLDQVKATGKLDTYFLFLEKYRMGDHLRYLHHLLDWAEERDVPVVLVDMPVSEDLERRYADAFQTYRQALTEVEHERRLIILRPRRADVGLTDADFADLIHLNADGSERLSRWLRLEITR